MNVWVTLKKKKKKIDDTSSVCKIYIVKYTVSLAHYGGISHINK